MGYGLLQGSTKCTNFGMILIFSINHKFLLKLWINYWSAIRMKIHHQFYVVEQALFSYIYSVAFNNWTEIIPLLILREILKLTVYGNVIVFKWWIEPWCSWRALFGPSRSGQLLSLSSSGTIDCIHKASGTPSRDRTSVRDSSSFRGFLDTERGHSAAGDTQGQVLFLQLQAADCFAVDRLLGHCTLCGG